MDNRNKKREKKRADIRDHKRADTRDHKRDGKRVSNRGDRCNNWRIHDSSFAYIGSL